MHMQCSCNWCCGHRCCLQQEVCGLPASVQKSVHLRWTLNCPHLCGTPSIFVSYRWHQSKHCPRWKNMDTKTFTLISGMFIVWQGHSYSLNAHKLQNRVKTKVAWGDKRLTDTILNIAVADYFFVLHHPGERCFLTLADWVRVPFPPRSPKRTLIQWLSYSFLVLW